MIRLSVIIPTRNRSEYLEQALSSITSQTLSQELFEVIVIDNGSTDDTKEKTYRFKDRIKHLNYIFESREGLHFGRHAGLFAAKGDILVYADDDIIAFDTWLESIMETFDQDKMIGLVGGKNLPKFEAKPPVWLMKMWEKTTDGIQNIGPLSIIDQGEQKKPCDPMLIYGCNFSIRKNLLLDIGGFHPDGMPLEKLKYRGDGESHVSSEMEVRGFQTIYNPEASVYHYVTKGRASYGYFRKRGYSQGISNSFGYYRENGICKLSKFNIRLAYLKERIMLMVKSAIKIFSPLHSFNKANYYLNKGIIEGWYFHKQQILSDSDLINWIRKESYYN